ncbi:o-succinylbenzoate--CoA ligase [Vibrio sp. SCSIO 43137]|uniref:o-succinylbenzoate--CoA ligase n=1 Tax=Vibrio sp. SCSIO 43137 TaxID=3021011 RepID=UPI0023074C8E|nr:o-succinylbenzoate--CoA ligase [Vibrio sp. SCSIO 43137]WCE30592.1 o-succinylbenzoate--CoA ligase [Vibrio sp. SCSIO 43137]
MKLHCYLPEFWAEYRKENPALITPQGRYSWSELSSEVLDISRQLLAEGLQSGDVLACVSKNSTELLFLYLACVRIGVIPALIAPQPLSPLVEKLQQIGCRSVWLGKEALAKTDSREQNSIRQHFNCIDPLQNNGGNKALPAVSALPEKAIVSLIFTSGSSGQAKAAAHCAENHLASAQGLLDVFEYKQADCWLLSLPMFHVSGLAIVWRWLSVGAVLKIGEGGNLADDLYQVSHASLVPTQLKRLLDKQHQISLTHVLLGGSHIPAELANRAKARGISTWLGYGMTEAASTVTAKQVDGKSGVGNVLPGRKIKLNGQNILIGGKTLALGYFYQGELTPLTDNGWFDSKDLGCRQDGELRILGRADNQFISGGENIHCEEIESVLLQHKDIGLAFVVPVADAEFGARPVALLSCNGELDPEQYKPLLTSRLDRFKWPIAYFQLPETVLQGQGIKVSRISVKQWFSEHQSTYQLVI